jgi:hypothetical protein
MPLTPRSRPAAGFRPSRLPAPRCRGGASSLLRLSQTTAGGLPSRSSIAGWAQRAAAQVVRLTTVPPFAAGISKAGSRSC